MSISVACVGLGRMGTGIAANIQRAGFSLTVYNRSGEKTKSFVEAGAKAAASPREAVASADIVITNLMDDASVLGVIEGEAGILAGMGAGAVHVGTTTISPRLSTQLARMHAERGTRYVAGPVAGRPDAAAAGKLFTFLAGEDDAIERARTVISSYAQQLIVTGKDPAVAMSMKLAGNFLVASLLELMGETYVFAESRGVDASILTNMLKHFMPAATEYIERISTRDFGRAGFTLDGGTKDVTLILEAAAEVNAPLSYASVVRDKCLAAKALGMGQLDWSCLTEVSRLAAGQKASRGSA
jgi:3-hydroxyisobutyrate dehydrogenase-like beta-hydroxyacid dehydrogenase